ncbi:uncharacterized protein TrAtP1_000943 [Trichoderma atroviride]|uniref:uncharacterized protein n=1 Tax=Hypocrea atroviridis TaxID=63577 RepID=UPI00332341A6|nr:hypothetical protein TrAtP1_000943 [Trichoderma atroviride]
MMKKTTDNKEGGALGGPKGIRGGLMMKKSDEAGKEGKESAPKEKEEEEEEGRKTMPQVTAAKVTLQIAEREDVDGSYVGT